MSHERSRKTFEQASRLADVLGTYIDEPLRAQYSNPTFLDDPRFKEYTRQLENIFPGFARQGYNTQQFGTLQNPPSYRGIRLLLPESARDIPRKSPAEVEESYKSFELNRHPAFKEIYQGLLGELIKRGYPIRGGTGQFYGYEPGFNPIGFGQRE